MICCMLLSHDTLAITFLNKLKELKCLMTIWLWEFMQIWHADMWFMHAFAQQYHVRRVVNHSCLTFWHHNRKGKNIICILIKFYSHFSEIPLCLPRDILRNNCTVYFRKNCREKCQHAVTWINGTCYDFNSLNYWGIIEYKWWSSTDAGKDSTGRCRWAKHKQSKW